MTYLDTAAAWELFLWKKKKDILSWCLCHTLSPGCAAGIKCGCDIGGEFLGRARRSRDGLMESMYVSLWGTPPPPRGPLARGVVSPAGGSASQTKRTCWKHFVTLCVCKTQISSPFGWEVYCRDCVVGIYCRDCMVGINETEAKAPA